MRIRRVVAARASAAAVACGLAALLLWTVGLALDHIGRTRFGSAAAVVNVLWADEVSDTQRRALEDRFGLTNGERRDRTYVYLLTDTSTENLRNLVRDPAVRDTHHVDRNAFSLADTAVLVLPDPTSQRRAESTIAMGRRVQRLAALAALLALLMTAAPVLTQRILRGGRSWVRTAAATLYARIPAVSPQGAALFRIVLAGAVLSVFALSPVNSIPAGGMPEGTPWLTRVAGAPFIGRPWLVDAIHPWILVTGTLTVLGLLTRLSFIAFTCGTIAWGLVYSMQSGHHPVSALLMAMICLLPSRWGDAWSVDALLRSRPAAAPREYGYTVWIPGVVLGIALAGAAAAKLIEGGFGWILNGTVKYHFITDAQNAPVDWGLRFALEPNVAVVLSFGAIAIESLILPVALFGPPALRLLAAAAAAAMFAAFWTFQGIAWPSWWVLLLSFLPWHLVRNAAAAVAGPMSRGRIVALRTVQMACVVALVTGQVAASAWRLEIPPLFSAYDMYSKTYASPEAYISQTTSRRLLATLQDGSELACTISEEEAGRATGAVESGARNEIVGLVLARCFEGEPPIVRAIAVEEVRREVDWVEGRYLGTTQRRATLP